MGGVPVTDGVKARLAVELAYTITGVHVASGGGVFDGIVGVGKAVFVGVEVFVLVGGGVYMAVCVAKKLATNVSTAPVPESSGVAAASFPPQATKKSVDITNSKNILYVSFIEITFLCNDYKMKLQFGFRTTKWI